MSDYVAIYNKTNYRAMVLTQEQMEINAKYIYNYLKLKYNCTVEACAGLLANAQAESTINPARPQNNAITNQWWDSTTGRPGSAPNPTTTHYGYGLFQVTPWGIFSTSSNSYSPYLLGNYAISNGYTTSYETGGTIGNMDMQLDWLFEQAALSYHNTAQPDKDQKKWYQDSRSPTKGCGTPKLYALQQDTPENMAITFYWNFERSGSNNPGNRPQLARAWYNFLRELPPPIPKSKVLKGGRPKWQLLLHLQQS